MPRLDNADAVFLGNVEVDVGISLGRTTVWQPPVPVAITPPVLSAGSVGDTLTITNGTYTNSPDVFGHQIQEETTPGTWVDVTGETGPTFTPDHAATYRVQEIASNDFYSSAPTNSAPVVVEEPSGLPTKAVRFTARSSSAELIESLIAAGGLNFTLGALVYIESGSAATWDEFSNMLDVEFTGGRYGYAATTNEFENRRLGVGGHGNSIVPSSLQPVAAGWYYVTLSGDGNYGDGGAGGQFRLTIQDLAGANAISSAFQAKGDFFGAGNTHTSCHINGTATDGWTNIRYQSVRLHLSYRTTTQIEADKTASDATGSAFWWEFQDDGVGGVTAIDKSGNSRTPTITGGLLADGPGA